MLDFETLNNKFNHKYELSMPDQHENKIFNFMPFVYFQLGHVLSAVTGIFDAVLLEIVELATFDGCCGLLP